MDKFTMLPSDSIEKYEEIIDFVFVTATPTETQALHASMKPLLNEDKLFVIRKGIFTYYVGTFGMYSICHVESKMGSIGIGASLASVQKAIDEWKPKAVVMVGIAFGIDRTKQNIGDILLAEQIIQYESKKVGSNYTISRGPHHMSSPILLDRFRNNLDWMHQMDGGEFSRLIHGPILSGEVLIDNIKYRDKLLKEFPKAIGGEMEGAGLLASAYSSSVHWILLKGICDFADGLKGVDKEANQKKAAEAAVSLCLSVFTKDNNFDGIVAAKKEGVKIIVAGNPQPVVINGVPDNNVLFNVYTPSVEEYYIEREYDALFTLMVEAKKSVWVYGGSGFGKTCLVFRNIYLHKQKFYTIDLSGCSNLSAVAVLNYINHQLNQFAGKDFFVEQHSLPNAIDGVLHTLRECFVNSECIVFEEIPVSKNGLAIIEALVSLFIKYENKAFDKRVCFMCTSIENPREVLNLGNSKIVEKVKFLEVIKWEAPQIQGLCNKIEDAIKLSIDSTQRDSIIFSSEGSPRFVKNIYTNLLAFRSNANFDFKKIMAFTKNDFPSHD